MKVTLKKDKTGTTSFHLFRTLKQTPDNWIWVKPVKIFGILIGRLLKVN